MCNQVLQESLVYSQNKICEYEKKTAGNCQKKERERQKCILGVSPFFTGIEADPHFHIHIHMHRVPSG